MKILFFADPHFRETSSYPPFNRIQSNGLSGALNNTLLGMTFLKLQIEIHEPDLVVLLGDTYHKDNVITVPTLHAAQIGFEDISYVCRKMGIDFLILMGNHDLYEVLQDGTKVTSICTLGGHGILITENMSYDLEDNFRIFLMPYCDDLEENYQSLLEGSKYDLIAAHTDFLGAVHDNGHKVEVGLDSHTRVPVICGHIHIPQVVGNVIYPGSLLLDRFSRESYEDVSGVMIFDTETMEKETIRNTLSKHFIKVTDLSKLDDLDPERCILKIYSEAPEGDVKDLLEGFQYMFIHIKDKNKGSRDAYIRQGIDKPENLLRAFIEEDRPEHLWIYDEVVK